MVNWLSRLARYLCSRTGAALVILLLGALATFVISQKGEPEPSYQNIPASAWLELVSTNSNKLADATTAFRRMGPAGAEFLGRELISKPSQMHEWLLSRHHQIPTPLKKLLLKPQHQPQDIVILELLRGLGTNAAPALPMLQSWLHGKISLLTVSTPLPPNGFSIFTNNSVFVTGFVPPTPQALSQNPKAPHILMVPPRGFLTIQTQAMVTAPGQVTTNIKVTVDAGPHAKHGPAFQILSNLSITGPQLLEVRPN